MSDDLIERFRRVASGLSGGRRAPHKPLLLLFALARLQRGESGGVSFAEAEEPLRRLLQDFGPPSTNKPRPEYPFWRLQNDGLWTVLADAPLTPSSAGDVSAAALRKVDAIGEFPRSIAKALRANPERVNAIAAELLERNFPRSRHDELLDAVGMPWTVAATRKRDPEFRKLVLRIYQRRCAVCGFDARLGHADLGLDAAHVKWHAAGGPDDASNGLCLCAIHHRALDAGAFTLADDGRIDVSEAATGGDELEHWLLRFAGKPLRRPLQGHAPPAEAFARWHRREVFVGPARKVA